MKNENDSVALFDSTSQDWKTPSFRCQVTSAFGFGFVCLPRQEYIQSREMGKKSSSVTIPSFILLPLSAEECHLSSKYVCTLAVYVCDYDYDCSIQQSDVSYSLQSHQMLNVIL